MNWTKFYRPGWTWINKEQKQFKLLTEGDEAMETHEN